MTQAKTHEYIKRLLLWLFLFHYLEKIDHINVMSSNKKTLVDKTLENLIT